MSALTLARSSGLPMRPGGTRAPIPAISCWKAESSCEVLSLLSSEPPVVISEGNHPSHNVSYYTFPELLDRWMYLRTWCNAIHANLDFLMAEVEG
jgi:hypothetical protein